MRAGARLAVVLTALTLAGSASTALAAEVASLPDIEDEVMCPICGTLLELSESPQAERQRVFIRNRIAEGQTKQQIKDALVAEYGAEVLAIPDDEGFDLVAWLLPGFALIVAAGAIGVGVRRWRRQDDRGPPPPPAESGRLDEDLARYDL